MELSRFDVTGLVIVAALSWLAFTGLVTWQVWRSNDFGAIQKASQTLLCLVLPGFGALMIWLVLRTFRDKRSRRDTKFTEEGNSF